MLTNFYRTVRLDFPEDSILQGRHNKKLKYLTAGVWLLKGLYKPSLSDENLQDYNQQIMQHVQQVV
jgi:hypothetical protein